MNEQSNIAPEKPMLNPEGFQRLLAAAYLLQLQNDRLPSIRPSQPVGASPATSFVAGTIVQKRAPSLTNRERQIQSGQPYAVADADHGIAKEYPYTIKLIPFVGPAVPHRMEVVLSGAMSWRTVESLAIGMVFLMMMGLQIHHLLAVSGRAPMNSGMLEEQNSLQAARPTNKALPSSQAPPNYRQTPIGGEADIVADDIVIRLQKRGVNLLGKPVARLTFGRDADALVAETAVQYGPDVTMWSRKSEGTTLNRLGH